MEFTPSMMTPGTMGLSPAMTTLGMPMGMGMGMPMGKGVGMPMGLGTGMPMGKGMGVPMGMGMGMPMGKGMGMPMGKGMGMPMGKGMGMPMGKGMGMPMGKAPMMPGAMAAPGTWMVSPGGAAVTGAPGAVPAAAAPAAAPAAGAPAVGGAPAAAPTPLVAGGVGPGMAHAGTSGGQSALQVGAATFAGGMPEAQGQVHIPGFAINVDTPLIQGGLNWPGWTGAMHWPGWAGMFHPPAFQAGAQGFDTHAMLHFPGAMGALLPDDPAED